MRHRIVRGTASESFAAIQIHDPSYTNADRRESAPLGVAVSNSSGRPSECTRSMQQKPVHPVAFDQIAMSGESAF